MNSTVSPHLSIAVLRNLASLPFLLLASTAGDTKTGEYRKNVQSWDSAVQNVNEIGDSDLPS
jgi:hypothetical protein